MRIVYPKKIAIGVDIGGTKIKAGLVDINGQIIGIRQHAFKIKRFVADRLGNIRYIRGGVVV